MNNKKITIDMVSKKANVSKATISRYLNEKYEFMSTETRENIKTVIEELGYRPNSIARSLKSKKSGLIGIIISDITNPFSSILVKGISDTCCKNGYQVIIANTDNDPIKEREYIISMLDRQVEGIIINTSGCNEDFLADLKAKGIVMTLADRTIKNHIIDTITTNNEKMTTEALNIIYKQGFDKIAFFTTPISENTSKLRRYNAFIDTISSFTSDAESLVYIIDEKYKYKNYDDALSDFINTYKDNNKAIFAVNGVVMLNLLLAIKRLNLKIPNDIGVCGYDDWGWAELVGDGISVISQPSYDVGTKSAEILIDRINNPPIDDKPKYIELSSKIILRGSTSKNYN